jgi:hypothetical protein
MHKPTYRDILGRFAQLGQSAGVRLVKLTSHVAGNVYEASVLTLDSQGGIMAAAHTTTLEVINLAEAEDSDGQIVTDTPAVAVDIEGRWVVYVQTHPNDPFVGELLYTSGTGLYGVRPQAPTGQSSPTSPVDFENNGATIMATNLAELGMSTLGLETGRKVIIHAVPSTDTPPVYHYVFDHPHEEEYG